MTNYMPRFDPQPGEYNFNKAWKSHLSACREDWEAGEISDEQLFMAVLLNAEPETARECLEVIGTKAADKFDHWFTMHYGTRIPQRDERIDPGPARKHISQWNWQETDRLHRIVEVFHRIVLDRREPL